MSLYFFDVTDGGRVTIDQSGIELADDEEARVEAISLCGHIARDLRGDYDQHEFVVAARNEAGQRIYEASLALNGRWWPPGR